MTNDRRSFARMPWTTVSTRPIYANPWIRVREDIAEVPDGRRTIYGVVEAKPADPALGAPPRALITSPTRAPWRRSVPGRRRLARA